MTIFTLGEGPAIAEMIGVVMEIEDGRKVDLGTTDVELGCVRCPCGVRRLYRELAVQHVLGCLADFSAEGVVPCATTHQALQCTCSPELPSLIQHLDRVRGESRVNATDFAVKPA